MKACANDGQWKAALELLDRMERKERLKADACSYHACIVACKNGGEWYKCLQLLREERSLGLEPTQYTYSTVISACEKAAQWEHAIEVLDMLKRDGGARANVIVYNGVISACEKGAQGQQAVALLEEMQREGIEPTVVSFSSAMIACAKSADVEGTFALFDELKRRKMQPDGHAYAALLKACGVRQESERALAIFEEAEACGATREGDHERALWCEVFSALQPASKEARAFWKRALAAGVFERMRERMPEALSESERSAPLSDTTDREHPMLDLHFLSVDAAEAAVRWWLEEEVPACVQGRGGGQPRDLTIVTGYGKSRSQHQNASGRSTLHERIGRVLTSMGAVLIPWRENHGNFVVDARAWFNRHSRMKDVSQMPEERSVFADVAPPGPAVALPLVQ